MLDIKDYGPDPLVINIEDATVQNTNFRTALWTGKYMQATLMVIEPGDTIGMEVHDDHDQFLRIEAGVAEVKMGPSQEEMTSYDAEDDFAIFVPAGQWHDVINTGDEPLKLYSIYSPAEHDHGTVHVDKAEAEAAEAEHSH